MSIELNHFVSETRGVKKTFVWKIYDYHASPLKKDSFLLSDTFAIENTRFCLKAQDVFLSYVKDGCNSGNWLYVSLLVISSLPTVDFTYSISLKNRENKNVHEKKHFVKCGEKPSGLFIAPRIKVSDATGLLADGCLTIYCTVLWPRTTKFRPAQETVLSCSRSDALSRDLWNLFTSKDKTDFVLRVEGQDIPVHSQILSARSPVFSAMFGSDFKENRTRIVDITDMGISEMNYLLQYIYTGEVRELKELSPDSLEELYTAAEKYDLKELKDMCSRVMQAKLSKDNVEKYAILAFTHGDQNTMAAVVALFGSNKDLMDSDLMRKLTKKIPTLPEQILKFVAKRM